MSPQVIKTRMSGFVCDDFRSDKGREERERERVLQLTQSTFLWGSKVRLLWLITAASVRAKGTKQRTLRCLTENEDGKRKELCIQVCVRETVIERYSRERNRSPMCSISHKPWGQCREEVELEWEFICRDNVRRGKAKPGGLTELSKLWHIQNEIHYPKYRHANERQVTQGSRQLTFETALERRDSTFPMGLLWA